MTEQEQLHDILHGPADAKAKRKPGRKPKVSADTFESALERLTPQQAQFTRHVLAGDEAKAAYTKVKGIVGQGAANGGSRWLARTDVKTALALGRKQGALAAITGLKYDVTAADAQIQLLIDEARASDQYSAVANLLKLKMTLHKLDQPQNTQQQGVQIILQTADGVTVRSFGGVPADNATDIEGEML